MTAPGTDVHTDEWHAYDDLGDRDRNRFSVNYNRKEWARDDDGDGIREVHSNRREGFWLGLRNFLRPFRGVTKGGFTAYVAFFQCIHNFRRDYLGLLTAFFGPITSSVHEPEALLRV